MTRRETKSADHLANALSRLNEELRKTLCAVPTPESPGRSRGRYIEALEIVADFFKEQGFHAPIVDDFAQLAQALKELDYGCVRHALRPAPRNGKPPDPGDLWRSRAFLCTAVWFLCHDRKMPELPAAEMVAQRINLKGDGFVDLVTSEKCSKTERKFNPDPAGAIRRWYREFQDGEGPATAEPALKLYSDRKIYIKCVFSAVIQAGDGPTDERIVDEIVRDALVHAFQAADPETNARFREKFYKNNTVKKD